MSRNLTDFSLTFLAWRGVRPTPLPFANDNFADIDLSTSGLDDLIMKLLVARKEQDNVTIRLGNDDYQKDVESLKTLIKYAEQQGE